MPLERYCFVMYPGEWEDENTSIVSGEEVAIFDRFFLGGIHAAIRRAKRAFRRNSDFDGISDFRLFRVTNKGREAVLMPSPSGRSYPPMKINWDEAHLSEVIN